MIGVLHLIPAQPDFQTARGANMLGPALGADFQASVAVVGRGGDYSHVLAAALDLYRRPRADVRIVHAWNLPSLAAAAVATKCPLVFSPPPVLSASSIGWLRAIMAYRDVHVVCATATQQRTLLTRGVPLERCHLIRPGVDFSRVRPRRDPDLRRRLRLAEDHRVLLAPGESTRPAAHVAAFWAVSILNYLDTRYRLLCWGRGQQVGALRRFAIELKQPELLCLAEQRLGRSVDFESLCPAADAALVTATDPVATLPIAVCMAAGLPIVATVTATVSELLEDRHSALMLGSPTARTLSQRILDLWNAPRQTWSIRDTARTEAYEFFAGTRFINQYRQLYRSVTEGRAPDVSTPEKQGRQNHGWSRMPTDKALHI
jgi:glycosyltransferase involved in cell wall biosynthesis